MVRKRKLITSFDKENIVEMSAFVLHCSVCSANLKTRGEWLEHLLEEEHQARARLECVRKWDGRMKECCLVIFSSFPVASQSVLQFFSGERREEVLVSDYVWWPKRPRVGFVVFESRERLNEVYRNNGSGPQVRIENQLVQLKKAVDFMELEWIEFFPEEDLADSFINSNCAPGYIDENETETVKEDKLPSKLKIKSLAGVFKEIRTRVEIPDEEYNAALQIIQGLEQLFTPLASQHGSSCKAYMFRHWYLKLIDMGTNELIIFLDAIGILECGGSFRDLNSVLKFSPKELVQVFSSPSAQRVIPGVWLVPKDASKRKSWPYGTRLKHNPSGLEFSIVTDANCITEVQTCRLLQYLLTFDPRAKSLLTLVHYWAKLNNVRLSEEGSDSSILQVHRVLTEPSGLEWLVICFLCNKNIIPTPREVIRRPHKKLLVGKNGSDIGFSEDTEFALEWNRTRSSSLPAENTDEFVLSVITLAKEFFGFCAILRNSSWLVNTRDGEVINQRHFLDSEMKQGVHWNSNLTVREVGMIRSLRISPVVKVARWPVVILQPFRLTWCFSFCSETFRESTAFKMLYSEMSLGYFVKRHKSNVKTRITIRSFKQSLRVTSGQIENMREMTKMGKKQEESTATS